MKRKPSIGKSLAELNPLLAKEWHPTKNSGLTPFDVTEGSNKKAWWKCDKGDDHEWEAPISGRSNRGRGCSICAGQKVVLSNCLATLNPNLAKEWHPTKNGNLTPLDVTVGTSKKVWWKCDKGEDHEWKSAISDRNMKGQGCSICSGRTVVLSNCLATLNSKLAKEWHPTKNGDLTPFDVTIGSNKKVWWKCDKGEDHEWQSIVKNRGRGLSASHCPVCAGQKVVLSNCLATLNPNLAKEWHPSKNGGLTPFDITIGSSKKVWWKCDKGNDHEWQTPTKNRNGGGNCPVCSGRAVVLSNCLATTHPHISKKWHPTKNGDLTPFDVTIGSNKKVWWKCDKGEDHEWVSDVYTMSSTICPVCTGKKVVLSNCLATLNPKLAKEWHPTKNGVLSPFDVTVSSNKKVWWKCDKGEDHEWCTHIYNRTKDRNCPYCTLTPQSKQELTITFELLTIFKDINPKGFKTKVNGKLWTIDIYIPQLHLGIEFDGSYWHKDKQALDKLKTEQLNEEGFDIIRVREEPLKKLSENDVISRLPYNGKKVTNDVLRRIMKMKKLDDRKLKLINNYLDKEGLQNEKGLDKYIDMILTQKGAT